MGVLRLYVFKKNEKGIEISNNFVRVGFHYSLEKSAP
jgi:hypothetical protein